MKLQKVRQTLKTKLSILIFTSFLLCSLQSCGQKNETKPTKKSQQTTKKVVTPDYSQVDYAKASNIIKRPKELKGDEKAVFYHPYFLKLTHEQAKNLKPLKVKAELEKLGIFLKDDKRFIEAFNFFDTDIIYHKKSCEQWESFKDLAPHSKN